MCSIPLGRIIRKMKDLPKPIKNLLSKDEQTRQGAIDELADTKEGRAILDILKRMVRAEAEYTRAISINT